MCRSPRACSRPRRSPAPLLPIQIYGKVDPRNGRIQDHEPTPRRLVGIVEDLILMTATDPISAACALSMKS